MRFPRKFHEAYAPIEQLEAAHSRFLYTSKLYFSCFLDSGQGYLATQHTPRNSDRSASQTEET